MSRSPAVLATALLVLLTPLPSQATPADAKLLLWFKAGLGDGAAALSSWNSTDKDAPCSWDGVGCDEEGRVVALELDGRGLQGTVPNTPLPATLQLLDISSNDFSGPLPSWSRLANATIYIAPGNSGLYGELPKSPFVLNFTSGERVASLPDCPDSQDGTNLDEMSDADMLLAFKASFTNGNDPSILPSWVKGTDPCANQWEGIGCTEGDLISVYSIDVSGKGLIGTIPDGGWNFNYNILQILDLSNNKLTGPIHSDWWAPEENMMTLDLHGNDFSGNLPSWTDGVNLDVYVKPGNDKLCGPVPDWNPAPRFMTYDPTQPDDGTTLQNGDLPDCNYDSSGSASGSSGDGENLAEMSDADLLLAFKASFANGNDPNILPSWVKGTDPCANQWEGISCTSGVATPYIIDVSGKGLIGTIPDGGWNLNYNIISVIDLSNNKLTGPIHSDWLGPPEYLEVLDLHGNNFSSNLPSWQPSASDLQVFVKPGNDKLCGPVPEYHPDPLFFNFDPSMPDNKGRALENGDLPDCN